MRKVLMVVLMTALLFTTVSPGASSSFETVEDRDEMRLTSEDFERLRGYDRQGDHTNNAYVTPEELCADEDRQRTIRQYLSWANNSLDEKNNSTDYDYEFMTDEHLEKKKLIYINESGRWTFPGVERLTYHVKNDKGLEPGKTYERDVEHVFSYQVDLENDGLIWRYYDKDAPWGSRVLSDYRLVQDSYSRDCPPEIESLWELFCPGTLIQALM